MVIMKKLILFSFVLSILILTSCGNVEKEGYWDTLFLDDFNRTDDFPGTNWSIKTGNCSTLSIKSNTAYYAYYNTTSNEYDTYAGMTYNDNINESKIIISSRFITGSEIENIECLGFRISGYPGGDSTVVAFNSEFIAFFDSEDNPLSMKNINLENRNDTEYILEVEIDGMNIDAELKDITGNTLHQLSTVVNEYSSYSVTVVFMGKALTTTAVDDFEIQVYKNFN